MVKGEFTINVFCHKKCIGSLMCGKFKLKLKDEAVKGMSYKFK